MTSSTLMKWVGGATAILTLLFGLQRVVTSVSDARVKRNRTSESVRAARLQLADRRYDEAWSTLQQAEAANSTAGDVRAEQEDVAMEWLDNIRVTPGDGTFTDVVRKVSPALVRGTLSSDGRRRADLTAHLGWADFLLWRDGRVELRPEGQYRRALDLDSTNAYAHAMWGHWILWRHGSIDEAQSHFAAAIRSGSHRDLVRALQISALTNVRDSTANAELTKVANEIQRTGEAISPDLRRRLAEAICHEPSSARSSTGISRERCIAAFVNSTNPK
jgi:hypothetical protein